MVLNLKGSVGNCVVEERHELQQNSNTQHITAKEEQKKVGLSLN